MSDPAALRKEFYDLPDDAKVDRATVAAVAYLQPQTMEKMAIKGGGPPYSRRGRMALYVKRDVKVWMESGQRVENTAQLSGAAA